jgi:transposase
VLATENDNTHTIPEEVAALKELVHQQRTQIAELRTLLVNERALRERAESKLADLLRRLYGPKSEKLSADQLLLFGIIDAPALSVQPAAKHGAGQLIEQKSARRGGGRRREPEHLPVAETVTLDLPPEQKAGLVLVRHEITWEIDYRPSSFFRRKFVRAVYAHPKRAHAPVMAAMPPRLIAQSMVGPGFVAHILVGKYVDHLPLYRQESIDARAGVVISRQARFRYLREAAYLLITIYQQIKALILASLYVEVDETFVKLLDADRGRHAHQAYLWTYLSIHARAVLFEFSTSRGAEVPRAFFPPEWAGVAQTDGHSAYPSAFRDRPHLVHLECMAHLRRKVLEAVRADEADAIPLLREITDLYRIEREADRRGLTTEQRGYWRHGLAKPVLKRLQRRFHALAATALPASKLGEAVTYAMNRWAHLAGYAKVGFGHVNIDQNPVERIIRPTKVGSKNWLFIGHPKAGWCSAVIYSIVGTCRLLGVNPQAYLTWVLPKLAAATNKTAVELLPHDYARLHSSITPDSS